LRRGPRRARVAPGRRCCPPWPFTTRKSPEALAVQRVEQVPHVCAVTASSRSVGLPGLRGERRRQPRLRERRQHEDTERLGPPRPRAALGEDVVRLRRQVAVPARFGRPGAVPTRSSAREVTPRPASSSRSRTALTTAPASACQRRLSVLEPARAPRTRGFAVDGARFEQLPAPISPLDVPRATQARSRSSPAPPRCACVNGSPWRDRAHPARNVVRAGTFAPVKMSRKPKMTVREHGVLADAQASGGVDEPEPGAGEARRSGSRAQRRRASSRQVRRRGSRHARGEARSA
jgi:hypothetical protein